MCSKPDYCIATLTERFVPRRHIGLASWGYWNFREMKTLRSLASMAGHAPKPTCGCASGGCRGSFQSWEKAFGTQFSLFLLIVTGKS